MSRSGTKPESSGGRQEIARHAPNKYVGEHSMQVVPPYPDYQCFRRSTSDHDLLAIDLSILAYSDEASIRQALYGSATGILLMDIVSSGDIQAIVARHAIPCSSPSTNTTFVAFRGTTTLQDWLVDFNFEKNRLGVHRGFYEAAMPLAPRIAKLTQGQNAVFTGHSLGAALATIAAAMVGARTKSIITFGSPRVGDAKFAKGLLGQLQEAKRYVHGEDIVPTVPMESLGFDHVGPERHLEQMPRPWSNVFCPRRVFDHVPIGGYAENLWRQA